MNKEKLRDAVFYALLALAAFWVVTEVDLSIAEWLTFNSGGYWGWNG